MIAVGYYYFKEDGMNQQRRTPRQYSSLEDLLDELNDAGHPNSQLWYDGQVIDGVRSASHPVAFLSADCKLIAQMRKDGTWWTLYGYDKENDPRIPSPADAWNVDDFHGQLTMFF